MNRNFFEIPLIDRFVDANVTAKTNGRWYMAKPLSYGGWQDLVFRVRCAWAVLTNQAIAVQFASDKYRKK